MCGAGGPALAAASAKSLKLGFLAPSAGLDSAGLLFSSSSAFTVTTAIVKVSAMTLPAIASSQSPEAQLQQCPASLTSRFRQPAFRRGSLLWRHQRQPAFVSGAAPSAGAASSAGSVASGASGPAAGGFILGQTLVVSLENSLIVVRETFGHRLQDAIALVIRQRAPVLAISLGGMQISRASRPGANDRLSRRLTRICPNAPAAGLALLF